MATPIWLWFHKIRGHRFFMRFRPLFGQEECPVYHLKKVFKIMVDLCSFAPQVFWIVLYHLITVMQFFVFQVALDGDIENFLSLSFPHFCSNSASNTSRTNRLWAQNAILKSKLKLYFIKFHLVLPRPPIYGGVIRAITDYNRDQFLR